MTSSRKIVYSDFPSVKYPDIDEPVNKVTLRRATSPPKPTLPRRATTRTWNATAKERNPLAAGLTGPGRAGKYGELRAQSGGRYEGEVLAGRPHGTGKFFTTKDGRSELQYEGDWVQGIREGKGVRYYPNGETYTGDFVANVRHGYGRYVFENGDVYAGEWTDDRRTGQGTFYYTNGDVFIGNFIKDRKEGMGTLLMMNKSRKYVAEYVAGQPRCGTVLNIEDNDLEPLRGELATLALSKKLDLAASGTVPAPLPELQLLQPNKVLATQVVTVRKARTEGSKDLKQVQSTSGTLTDKEIEMLRHSFTLMAAGDDPKVGLLPHQLRELCVMAGLDPASEATRQLVEQLLQQRDERSGRINVDSFLKVVIHFKEQAPEPVQEGPTEVAEALGYAAGAEQYAEEGMDYIVEAQEEGVYEDQEEGGDEEQEGEQGYEGQGEGGADGVWQDDGTGGDQPAQPDYAVQEEAST
eukprot:CAMPEP_0202890548 /NCGR_PEP_ID=MMETSP1392-20130828/910_1 /ASSEMBLY_ACC=CAM_ASM_000868 /TAXON_ID=225041 /ORGANISM="Chlamydomonas chlamydogama, Strain SAG 11-48b" /LENGTH=466 /DNA_ID=CAMNT_0049574137 /DNA_START=156 /DNA_END=1559 /DNA_ORIENTATION=+